MSTDLRINKIDTDFINGRARTIFTEMDIVYDVAHNIAKMETHKIYNREEEVLVHRKGATRAFGPGCEEVPEKYRAVGQPVLIPGTMGTASYILHGTDVAMEEKSEAENKNLKEQIKLLENENKDLKNVNEDLDKKIKDYDENVKKNKEQEESNKKQEAKLSKSRADLQAQMRRIQ